MKKFLLIGCCIAACLTGESYAQHMSSIEGFGEIILHRASIYGAVQWTDSEIVGSEVDLDGTLGLDKTNGVGIKAGMLFSGTHEMLADYRRYDVSDEAELSATVSFGGIELPSFLPITPSLTFQSVGVFYGYRVNNPYGVFSIRPGIQFIEYDVGLEVDLPLMEIESLAYSDNHIVPFVWLAGEIYLHPMASLTGELSGGWMQDQAAYWGQAMLKFLLHPNLSALLGYSHLWFQDEQDDNVFRVALSGFALGLQTTW